MTLRRTPTETLMAVLEEFGKDEPQDFIVVYTTQGGDLCTNASTDVISTRLGLLEAAEYERIAMRGMKEVE